MTGNTCRSLELCNRGDKVLPLNYEELRNKVFENAPVLDKSLVLENTPILENTSVSKNTWVLEDSAFFWSMLALPFQQVIFNTNWGRKHGCVIYFVGRILRITYNKVKKQVISNSKGQAPWVKILTWKSKNVFKSY